MCVCNVGPQQKSKGAFFRGHAQKQNLIVCHFSIFWLTLVDRQHFKQEGFVKPCLWFQCLYLFQWSHLCLGNIDLWVEGCAVSWRIIYPSESISIQSWSGSSGQFCEIFRKECKSLSLAPTGALVAMTPWWRPIIHVLVHVYPTF